MVRPPQHSLRAVRPASGSPTTRSLQGDELDEAPDEDAGEDDRT
jgi:hypothetical protein